MIDPRYHDDPIPDPVVTQRNTDALKLAMGARPAVSADWTWQEAQATLPRHLGLQAHLRDMKGRLILHFGGNGAQLTPARVEEVRVMFGRCLWNIAAAVFLNFFEDGLPERSPLQEVDYLRCLHVVGAKKFFGVGVISIHGLSNPYDFFDTDHQFMLQWLYENAYDGDISSAGHIALTVEQKRALFYLCLPIRRNDVDNLAAPREMLGVVERLMFNLHDGRVPSYGAVPPRNAPVVLNPQFMDRLLQEALAGSMLETML